MTPTNFVLACLLSALPGPPGVSYEDAYLQLFPVDKTKCPTIDPVRDIVYQLFTRNNPLMADVIRIGDDEALARSHMNFSDPTVIFFHAFFESSTATTAWTIKTAYLQRKQHNIILLNAPRLEAGPWYFTAARNTRVVGEYTAQFIDYLVSRGLQLHSLHLLGLSLGAQMAGITGSNVRSGRIPRITGLDPAGPLFSKLPRSLRLDKSDAEFVDIIHTDAGIFGFPRPLGHVDFWPNRGISPQPGCTLSEIKKRNPDTLLELAFCSHWRSYQFYAESLVNDYGFLSVQCKSWKQFATGRCDPNQEPINMGYNVPHIARGNYFLRTNPESPFSLEGNPLTLAESQYNDYDNDNSLGTPDSQNYLQENLEAVLGNGYNILSSYYPETNANFEIPNPVSNHNADDNHLFESQVSLQENYNSEIENEYNTQSNYSPETNTKLEIPNSEANHNADSSHRPESPVSQQENYKSGIKNEYNIPSNYYPETNANFEISNSEANHNADGNHRPESPVSRQENSNSRIRNEYYMPSNYYPETNVNIEITNPESNHNVGSNHLPESPVSQQENSNSGIENEYSMSNNYYPETNSGYQISLTQNPKTPSNIKYINTRANSYWISNPEPQYSLNSHAKSYAMERKYFYN